MKYSVLLGGRPNNAHAERESSVCKCVYYAAWTKICLQPHKHTTQGDAPVVTSTGPGETAFTVEQQEWSVSLRGCRRQIELKPD